MFVLKRVLVEGGGTGPDIRSILKQRWHRMLVGGLQQTFRTDDGSMGSQKTVK